MSDARDTVTVIAKSPEANCAGCFIDGVEGQGPEGFINPDCAYNRAVRSNKGLDPVSCGRILTSYAVDREHQKVVEKGRIVTRTVRILRLVFTEHAGGRLAMLEHDISRTGGSPLIIDFEDHSSI